MAPGARPWTYSRARVYNIYTTSRTPKTGPSAEVPGAPQEARVDHPRRPQSRPSQLPQATTGSLHQGPPGTTHHLHPLAPQATTNRSKGASSDRGAVHRGCEGRSTRGARPQGVLR